MYFLDIDILTKQLLPPHWRSGGKMAFLNSVLTPLKKVLSDFEMFRKTATSGINLSAQVVVVESYIEQLTGIAYGVYLAEGNEPGHFSLNIPEAGRAKEKEITLFLKKIIPAGRGYELMFY